jgi:hypothetical protein
MDYVKQFLELIKQKATDTEWKPIGECCYEKGHPSVVIRILFILWRNLSQRLDAIEAAQLPSQEPIPLVGEFPSQEATLPAQR